MMNDEGAWVEAGRLSGEVLEVISWRKDGGTYYGDDNGRRLVTESTGLSHHSYQWLPAQGEPGK